MKILLVDDDPDLLAVTGFALQQAGFLVVKAADGMAGLEAFEREQRLRSRAKTARTEPNSADHAYRTQRGS
jgi:DNA-binding response OmpR family regulator